ncbi:hypothetical protein L6452_04905 [Arctium lappa]|uniref:Uncharacterized protein n=1 Tax=Arctium lappa TaxID=4217 RepID=A0ACB9EFI3_ARCLA|nr:hypothetical protein L6452_04905 [Arctium lappa]
MERNTPVRKPHTSTADLLTWSENPAADSPATGSAASAARSSARSHQPSDGISKVVFGGQVTDEEVESLNKRKPVSGYKLKEITGSGIFAAGGENHVEETDAANPTPNSKTGLRMYQQTVAGISHISFGEEETVSPKKAISEAKQRELSGTLDSESEARLKKQISDAKNKELSGHNIFAPPPEIQPRPLAARALALRESISIGESSPHNTNAEEPVKTAKKIPSQKFTELSGNNIFKGDEGAATAEKPLSSAKLREMSGSNIFADGKAESRDYLGGVRKPPGGESSIALV